MIWPCVGRFWGTTRANSAPPLAWRARTVSTSLAPPRVSLATMRIRATTSFPGRCGGDGARGLRLGGRLEHPVDGAGDAIFVGPTDDRRHVVEVEDRGRGG